MGQKYAVYNAAGAITAFYDSIDSPVPSGVTNAIEITDAQWQICLASPGWTVANGVLAAPVPPTAAQLLALARAAQLQILSAACTAAITGGFAANALGAVYNYPSTLIDQANQNTVSNCATGGLLWCASGGAWSFRLHTQAQAQAVVAGFAAWLNRCQLQLVTLTTEVNAAASVAAVQGIAWTVP
jgi:hypothetical protein